MSFELAENSFNIFNGNNFVSLLKLYGVSILLSIMISLIIGLVLYVFGVNVFSVIILFFSILMGQVFAIRLFERWDGCYFQKQSA
jgi:hypothetical protein